MSSSTPPPNSEQKPSPSSPSNPLTPASSLSSSINANNNNNNNSNIIKINISTNNQISKISSPSNINDTNPHPLVLGNNNDKEITSTTEKMTETHSPKSSTMASIDTSAISATEPDTTVTEPTTLTATEDSMSVDKSKDTATSTSTADENITDSISEQNSSALREAINSNFRIPSEPSHSTADKSESNSNKQPIINDTPEKQEQQIKQQDPKQQLQLQQTASNNIIHPASPNINNDNNNPITQNTSSPPSVPQQLPAQMANPTDLDVKPSEEPLIAATNDRAAPSPETGTKTSSPQVEQNDQTSATPTATPALTTANSPEDAEDEQDEDEDMTGTANDDNEVFVPSIQDNTNTQDIKYEEITDPSEIKQHQERIAEEYKELAKSLARAKASRTTAMVNAMRKGKRFAMFDSVYKAQDSILERRKAMAKKHLDYNTYMIRKVTLGEVDNLWFRFFDAKQRLQERLISEVNEKIAQLNYEYSRCQLTKLSLPMKLQVQNYRQIALNLGVYPGVTPLTDDQIDTDLYMFKSGGHPPSPIEPQPSEANAESLNALANYSESHGLSTLDSIADAASAASPLNKFPFPSTQMPQPPQFQAPPPKSSIMSLLSPEATKPSFAIDNLIDNTPQPPIHAPGEDPSNNTIFMFEYGPKSTSDNTGAKASKRANVAENAPAKSKRQKVERKRGSRKGTVASSRSSSTGPVADKKDKQMPGDRSPSSSRGETPLANTTLGSRQLPPISAVSHSASPRQREEQFREQQQEWQVQREREEWRIRQEQDEWRAKERAESRRLYEEHEIQRQREYAREQEIRMHMEMQRQQEEDRMRQRNIKQEHSSATPSGGSTTMDSNNNGPAPSYNNGSNQYYPQYPGEGGADSQRFPPQAPLPSGQYSHPYYSSSYSSQQQQQQPPPPVMPESSQQQPSRSQLPPPSSQYRGYHSPHSSYNYSQYNYPPPPHSQSDHSQQQDSYYQGQQQSQSQSQNPTQSSSQSSQPPQSQPQQQQQQTYPSYPPPPPHYGYGNMPPPQPSYQQHQSSYNNYSQQQQQQQYGR